MKFFLVADYLLAHFDTNIKQIINGKWLMINTGRKENIVKDKSFDFAVMIVNLFKMLIKNKKEFILSKQLLKSGTAIGAMIREAEHAESKADFIHKMAMAQKECNESMYWLELLNITDYLSEKQFENTFTEADELIKIITRILITAKQNHKH